VRLIAATNKNLKRAVDEGEFRADLYYRVNSFPIEMPPLRERPEDIPALAEYLVKKQSRRMGKDIQSISARTIRFVTTQKWPGNVRQLEGFIQRALISASGPVLDYSEPYDSSSESSTSPGSFPANESADFRNAERRHILKVLQSTAWVIDGKHGAAKMMGIAASTLRSKMKRLEIQRPP
jgi:transcriptional regulator with GAF, ATPase, and Fis domain